MAFVCSNGRLFSLIKTIIDIPSEKPSGNEFAVGEYIFSFLEKLGFHPQKQVVDTTSFNIICCVAKNPGGKTIMYNGHIDVVPAGDFSLWTSDPYKCTDRDNRLYGRGTCDMKGSVGCMLYLAECLAEGKILPKNNLVLTFTVDEEHHNAGIKRFMQENYDVDYCIIGEPTELDIAIGHRGVSTHMVETYAKNCHIAESDGVRNAIYDALEIVNLIRKKNTELKNHESFLGSPQWKVTQIDGGTKSNVNPNYCRIMADRRFVFGETKETLQNDLDAIIAKLSEEKIKYTIQTYVAPALVSKDCQAVKDVLSVFRIIKEKEPRIKAFEAGCEQSFIQSMGIECIVWGPGSLKQAHKIDEYVEKQQLVDYVNIMVALIG